MHKKLTLKEKLKLFNQYLENKRADNHLMVESMNIDFYDEANNKEIELTTTNLDEITQDMLDYGFALRVTMPINQKALDNKHRSEAEENNITSTSISIVIDTKKFEEEIYNITHMTNNKIENGYWTMLDVSYHQIIREGISNIHERMGKKQDELLEEFLSQGAQL